MSSDNPAAFEHHGLPGVGRSNFRKNRAVCPGLGDGWSGLVLDGNDIGPVVREAIQRGSEHCRIPVILREGKVCRAKDHDLRRFFYSRTELSRPEGLGDQRGDKQQRGLNTKQERSGETFDYAFFVRSIGRTLGRTLLHIGSSGTEIWLKSVTTKR